MADPFRLRVLKAICAALEEITEANGCAVDLEGHVFRGYVASGDNDPLPLVTVYEPTNQAERKDGPPNSAQALVMWELYISGFFKGDPRNSTDVAYVAMAEVKKRLAAEATRASVSIRGTKSPFLMNEQGQKNRVEDIRLGSGVVRPADGEISTRPYFWLPVELKIVEDNRDPFG